MPWLLSDFEFSLLKRISASLAFWATITFSYMVHLHVTETLALYPDSGFSLSLKILGLIANALFLALLLLRRVKKSWFLPVNLFLVVLNFLIVLTTMVFMHHSMSMAALLYLSSLLFIIILGFFTRSLLVTLGFSFSLLLLYVVTFFMNPAALFAKETDIFFSNPYLYQRQSVIFIFGILIATIGIILLEHHINGLMHARLESDFAYLQNQANYDQETGLPNGRQLDSVITTLAGNSGFSGELLIMAGIRLDGIKELQIKKGYEAANASLASILLGIKAALLLRYRKLPEYIKQVAPEFYRIDSGILVFYMGLPRDAWVSGNIKLTELENLIKDVLLHTAEGLGLSFYGAFDVYPVHTESPEQLKHHVLNMLHQYSLENESRFVPFDAEKYLDFLRKEQIREGLRSKTLSDELRTVFQPKLTSDGVVCIGFEALVRWDSLGLGMVSPAEFIPLAENTNAIRVITNRVFRDCVSMAENLLAAGATVFRISFNMSPVLLIAEYLEDLIKNIQQSGLAQYFEIEITEGILMKSEQFVSDHFNRLSELGVQFSIDDFGTGYSNLSYLQNFAAEVLKIDMQFIKDLPGSEKNANLVNAIINMAKSFNMKTIAEGVETNAQACLLQESGCTYIQGYFYAKPLDAAEALAFLLEHRDLNGRSKNQCT